jgi:hypothetical protein
MIKTTTIENNMIKKTANLLFISIAVSLLMYMFFVVVAIASTTHRESVVIETQALYSHISEIEEEYMALEKNITLAYALSLGFQEPNSVLFAARKTFAINTLNILNER